MVKEQAAAHSASLQTSEPAAEDEPVSDKPHDVQTDPTVANAGLTEIDAGTDVPMTNGHLNGTSAEAETEGEGETSIPNADVGGSAANAAAEKQWDVAHEGNDLAASQEWVEVQKPADTPQTETAPNAAPAVAPSWADDHPEPTSEVSHRLPCWKSQVLFMLTRLQSATPVDPATPADPNDGFQSVQRTRGRGDREGGFSRGRGGGYRGRGGPRGDGQGHRGRGRGGSRGGGRGGFRREGGNEGSA